MLCVNEVLIRDRISCESSLPYQKGIYFVYMSLNNVGEMVVDESTGPIFIILLKEDIVLFCLRSFNWQIFKYFAD